MMSRGFVCVCVCFQEYLNDFESIYTQRSRVNEEHDVFSQSSLALSKVL